MSERITDKDLATKVARKRLSVLEMAEALGNVSEACRRSGMDRTSFYEWRRRFQTHGLEGLKDLPPIMKSQQGGNPVSRILLQDAFYLATLVALSLPLGNYFYKVMTGQRVHQQGCWRRWNSSSARRSDVPARGSCS